MHATVQGPAVHHVTSSRGQKYIFKVQGPMWHRLTSSRACSAFNSFLFNAVIDTLNLRELELTGRKFTWANHLQNQTFEKLDRILVCMDFESKYPLSTVVALRREISNHTPLLFSTNSPSLAYHPQFKFELGWLLRDDFCDMVRDVWLSVIVEGSPLERWQAKIRRLR
jgi:hypothetical protein